jgi:hypothetical protein
MKTRLTKCDKSSKRLFPMENIYIATPFNFVSLFCTLYCLLKIMASKKKTHVFVISCLCINVVSQLLGITGILVKFAYNMPNEGGGVIRIGYIFAHLNIMILILLNIDIASSLDFLDPVLLSYERMSIFRKTVYVVGGVLMTIISFAHITNTIGITWIPYGVYVSASVFLGVFCGIYEMCQTILLVRLITAMTGPKEHTRHYQKVMYGILLSVFILFIVLAAYGYAVLSKPFVDDGVLQLTTALSGLHIVILVWVMKKVRNLVQLTVKSITLQNSSVSTSSSVVTKKLKGLEKEKTSDSRSKACKLINTTETFALMNENLIISILANGASLILSCLYLLYTVRNRPSRTLICCLTLNAFTQTIGMIGLVLKYEFHSRESFYLIGIGYIFLHICVFLLILLDFEILNAYKELKSASLEERHIEMARRVCFVFVPLMVALNAAHHILNMGWGIKVMYSASTVGTVCVCLPALGFQCFLASYFLYVGKMIGSMGKKEEEQKIRRMILFLVFGVVIDVVAMGLFLWAVLTKPTLYDGVLQAGVALIGFNVILLLQVIKSFQSCFSQRHSIDLDIRGISSLRSHS